jgi:catechol 2,3-dioxygenase-like lactoylglutathione lyase family enzyme
MCRTKVQPLVRPTSKQTSEESEEDTMSRVQLALRVSDLEGSIRFYSSLFGVEPAKRRPGYANFAVIEPPLKLVLLESPGRGGTINHLGVEVESVDRVDEEQTRLTEAGLGSIDERGTTCCYAQQDKFWVEGAPDGEQWEVYTVLADSPSFYAGDPEDGPTCCGSDRAADTADQTQRTASACC